MYDFETEKKTLLTEDGQRLFLEIRDNVHKMLSQCGAVRCDKAMSAHTVGAYGSWTALACVERLIELGEIREVTKPGMFCQHRVFVKA